MSTPMLVSINNQTGGIINVFNNVSATIHQSNGQQTIDIHSPSSGAIGNNVKKDSTQVSDCQSDSRTQRGRRIQRLFVDEQTAGQEKNRLLNFLHRHNLGSREFDSSEDSSVNQIAVCFYRQWAKRGLLDNKAGSTAYVRFLKYDCELPISVIEKALGNVLSRMINSKQNYPQWSGEISEYFQN